jgi:hypothetical protein
MCVTSMTFVRDVMAWRNLERDLLQHDSLAPDALLPRGDHPSVVLVRDDHFVALLQVETVDHDLVRLARVSDDGDFLGVAPEFLREFASCAFHSRLQDSPHMFNRKFVCELQVSNHLLEHVARRWRDPSVVQIDQGPVGIEGALYLRPVQLVFGNGRRRLASCERVGPEQVREGVLAEHREYRATERETANERSPTRHRHSPRKVRLPSRGPR